MSLELASIDKKKTGFFRFKKLKGRYLLTNDASYCCFLEPADFKYFLDGKTECIKQDKCRELAEKGFIRDTLDFDDLSERFLSKNSFLYSGTNLHIIVVTLRCNHRCVYCQSSPKGLDKKQFDMDLATARSVVDRIFESTSRAINIEFQGGEPLANFETVKFIIEYAKKKNKSAGKDLLFSLVSNYSLMTEEKLKFLINNTVSFCTSLDGPEHLHNRNRVFLKNNSYKNAVKWIKKIQKVTEKSGEYKYKQNALATITRYSLPYPKQIVDEYIDLGLQAMFLRPVNPFGMDKKLWDKIKFSADEFMDFYRKAVEHIIEINKNGGHFYERTAAIILRKVLGEGDSNFLDMRSPCGAGIGQIAYNFNGNVYTCDEARMLSGSGDESFLIGNVFKNTHKDFIDNETVKALCVASCLDNLAGCSECVYKPFCGVCPIYSYFLDGDIFTKGQMNEKCKINSMMMDYIFEKLSDESVKEIFSKWAGVK